MVQPRNNPSLVSEFIALIGLQPSSLLRISIDESQLGQVSATSLIKFPNDQPITAYELFSYWLNL